MSKPAKSTAALADSISQIGHRIDQLVDRGHREGIWPKKIFDEEFVLRTLFPDNQPSPMRTLCLMTMRVEVMVRFLEENLIPELDDRAKAEAETEKAADAPAPH